MQIRNTELIETEKFQFLRIHKNGNWSIQKIIEELYKDKWSLSTEPSRGRPRFAVIRDPYSRFISGLKYDLERQKVDIKDINIKKLFVSNEIHLRNLLTGNIKHSISQVPYLINTGISHYIDIEDLNLFLKMHFGKSQHINKSNMKTEEIEKYLNKDDIMKYLHLDYYIYNSIKHSPFLWEWQHGKIF